MTKTDRIMAMVLGLGYISLITVGVLILATLFIH